jgi:hypothetical protein
VKHRTFIFKTVDDVVTFIKKADPPIRAWWRDHVVRVTAQDRYEEDRYETIAKEIGVVFEDEWSERGR